MRLQRQPRLARARLEVETLEDRTTPAKLDDALSLALPQLVATGAVAGDRVNVVMASTDTSAADEATLAAAPFAASVEALGFGIYSVTLAPGADLAAAVAYYGQSAGVISAAPDTVVSADQIPNDTYYSSLYGMTKIGAPAAWDTATGNGSFVVAVIDTGIDYTHPDLAANVWTNPGEIPGNGIDDDHDGFVDDVHGWNFVNNTGDPRDDNGHGTHVSGTIGAVGNNALGVAGVNWSVQIMALKFLNAQGSGYTSAAVSALNFAVNHGVKVSNNSWGGGGYDGTLAAAIGRAQTAGHIFVAAAGNSGLNIDTSPSYPASYIQTYDNVVTVAATDSNDNLASFSNYGPNSVTLAAPGVSILSTTPNNTYSYFSGTSMATPHVTGAIALYWGANPGLSYSDVIAKLKSSVDPLSNLTGKVSTGGRLDVGKMFATSPPPPAVAPGPKVTSAAFGGTPSTQFDTLHLTFDRTVDPNTFDASDIVGFTGPGGTNLLGAVTGVTAVSGTQFDVHFTPQTLAGSYSMVIGPNVLDTSGNPMNQNGNATAGEVPGDQYTAAGSLVLTTNKTYSTGPISVTIPDLRTITSTITVTDDLKISDLNVTVNITHTWDSDLVITLRGPTGAVVTLFNRRGGSGDNLSGTTFDDEATRSIAFGSAPFSGSYRPEQKLSAFDGTSTKGTWTLTVSDRAAQDSGRLTGWSFAVTGTNGGLGGMRVTALGFRDDPAAPTAAEPTAETADDTVAAPIVVSAAASPPSAPAGRLLAWMSSEARRADDAPPATGADRDEAAPTAPGYDFAAPAAAAYAVLYFPPEATNTRGDGSDEFAAE